MSASGATLLRLGTNALYRLPAIDIVARIGLSPDAAATADKEIRVAGWLESNHIAAVRAARSMSQPCSVDGVPVTFWDWIPIDPDPPSPGALGEVLQRLHLLSGAEINLPQLDPLGPARARLATAGGEDAVLGFLRDECDRLDGLYAELDFKLPVGPVHGDAHVDNLVQSGGQAVLIDLEAFATGPREWDLIPTAVRHERFGLARRPYLDFARAYGFDVIAWSGSVVLKRMREVLVASWLLGPAAVDQRAGKELKKRVASLRDPESTERWEAI